MESVESKLDSELKPVLNTLKQKLDLSKENFEQSDKILKDYFNSVMQNLTDSMNGVFNLNEAVCGDATTDDQRCSAKCGGSQCDGKCGTNTTMCSGLVDSYWQLAQIRDNFDDLYSKQEMIFKRILTKVYIQIQFF